MTYREIIYIILDQLKNTSDDSLFTEDHISFLADKYRTFLLKQRYSDIKKQIPESNYQTICLDLIKVPAIDNYSCGGYYLKSKEKIPYLMKIGNPVVYPTDYFQGNITYISRDRMRYVGDNKYLQNIIYTSLGPDNYLYLKSSNPQFLHLQKVRMTAIFENPKEVANLQCPDSKGNIICDPFDIVFPLEEALVPQLIELIVKELAGTKYMVEDKVNDADDTNNNQYNRYNNPYNN